MSLSPSGASTKASQWLVGAGVIGFALLLQIMPMMLLPHPMGFLPSIAHWVVQAPLLIVALLLVFYIARKRRWSTGTSVVLISLTAVAVGALAGVFAHQIVLVIWGPDALPGPPGVHRAVSRSLLFGGVSGVFIAGFWALGFVYPSSLEAQRILELEQERLRLERAAFETQSALHRLRARLEPHFLLNTLNAISGLVTQDSKQARRLIATLGELLSDALSDDELVSVAREIKWLQSYASLLETRFAGRLSFEWEIDESSTGAQIPHLLLQPLLENATSHGALRSRDVGSVSISISKENSPTRGPGLSCVVADNGPGFDESKIRPGAFGIEAVRRRLALLDQTASLSFDRPNGERTGTVVRVWLPWRAA